MRILVELTYYRPHTSGLTIYAERLAQALVRRGHQVTVLTSQYDRNLPREEVLDSVRIIRVPVLFRVSKGVIMPAIGWMATRLIRNYDVVHLHLPQFDAAGFALRGRLFEKPTVITYHCDLKMPKGLLSWIANQAVILMNHLSALFTHRLVTYTQDYADHSKLLGKFKKKISIIDPPVVNAEISQQEVLDFKEKFNDQGDRFPLIGMAARFATEKGVEVLIASMADILTRYPKAQVWFAGPYQNILGEQDYFRRLWPEIDRLQTQGNWKFIGLLDTRQMSAFYRNIDVLVVPSLNSTEAFGLVQIEAMMNGVPVVASDLPGVRQPALRHQMGQIVPIGDSGALAKAVISVVEKRGNYHVSPQELITRYSPDRVAEQYEELFERLMSKSGIKRND